MKNAVIIHGRPEKEEYFDPVSNSPSNDHWFPWLQKQLLMKGVLAQTPEMPSAYAPDYDEWKSVFELFKIDEDTILIGHSRGGAFLLRWLSEHPSIRVNKVVLVAPSLEPSVSKEFSIFTLDPQLVERTEGLYVFYSIDDEQDIFESAQMLKSKLPNAVFKEYTDKGHFTLEDLGTNEFPELLESLGL
jgi:predicted alpha/beta hydrolase family esterase